jgi:hypothetical protein
VTIQCQSVGSQMGDEYEKSGRKGSWINLRSYSETCLEGLRETPKNSVPVADFPSESRTEYFPYTSM